MECLRLDVSERVKRLLIGHCCDATAAAAVAVNGGARSMET